jgi:hypothetical protein
LADLVLNRHRHLKGRVREDQMLQAILESG